MSTPLNYRHLHYFWVAAQEGSFTRTAERLVEAVQTVSAVPNPRVPVNPPVAADDVAATTQDRPVDLPIARLLANDSDPDGDVLTLSLPAPASAQGGSVAVNGEHVRYVPPAGFTGVDTFDYVASDSEGNSDSATVTVTVRKEESLGLNVISATRNADDSVRLEMAGIPGQPYQILYTADLGAGPWTVLATVAADSGGVVSYTDATAIGVPVRFYRLAEAP